MPPNNPKIAQGSLNRVRCSIVIPGYPALNISSSYMGKNFASINFEGNFDEQIETGTGVVTSPEPYVMATVTVDLLRTQALAYNWLNQATTLSDLGPISIFSDTSAFPEIDLDTTVIRNCEPGVFDGKNPVVRLTLRGVLYANNNLWSMI
jgi:hypothetical protein